MVNKLKELRNSGSEEGFTLIELMIVVVIIGILAAIAIPIFMNQQKGAIAAGVKSDVKNTNTNIVTALVKSPTAALIGAGTAAAPTGTYTTTATSIPVGTTTAVAVVTDTATTLTIGGTWAEYVIKGTNTSADPATITFTSKTGKLS